MMSYLLEAKFLNSRWNNEKQVDDKIKVDQKMQVSHPIRPQGLRCSAVRSGTSSPPLSTGVL